MPSACVAEPATLMTALRRAPGAVVLQDGTRLSRCVSAARTDGDLQSLGLSLGSLADALRARAGDRRSAPRCSSATSPGRCGRGARRAPAGSPLSSRGASTQLAALPPEASAAGPRGVRARAARGRGSG